MTCSSDIAGRWPDPRVALDNALDLAGVISTTGCTEQDFADLAEIFLQEVGNMTRRLNEAEQSLNRHQDPAQWPQAVEKLRTAAHELTTSFGIVGARCAEAYSRHTQLRTRKSSALAEPPPSPTELLTAASALLGAVNRVADLLRSRA